jgi:hypothetical protein
LDYVGYMKHPTASRNATSEEVPVIEVAGHLAFVVPRETIERLEDRRDAKTIVARYPIVPGPVEKYGQAPGKWKLELAKTPSDLTLAITRLLSTFETTPRGSAIQALTRRLERALGRAITIAEDAQINGALESPTDIGAVVELLRSTIPRLPAEQDIDPHLGGSIASLKAEKELLGRAGGLEDAKWVAKYLSIDPKSVAAKARRNEILAIPRGDRNLYPAFQFRNGRVIPGIREVLEALPLKNGWSRLSFLLTPDPGLDDRSPIDAFGTEPEATLELARSADIQGAA